MPEWMSRPYGLLKTSLAISVFLAFPIEQIIHTKYLLGFGPSCSAAVPISLTLGNIVQAILPPLLVFLVPGPGSILGGKVARTGVNSPPAVLFIAAGLVCAATIPVVCWYGLREYAALHNTCGELFDLGRPVDVFHVNFLSNFAHYFIYLSVFSAFWVGMAAGALRLQSVRAAARNSAGNEAGQFQGFRWVCFLVWAVQYRLSQWIFAPLGLSQTEWVEFARMGFITLTVCSLWVLPFTRSLWNKRPRTRREAVLRAFWKSLLIYLVSALTFVWSPLVAGGILSFPFATLNAFGLVWALIVGNWQWRAWQAEQSRAMVPTA